VQQVLVIVLCGVASPLAAAEVLVEAEGFAERGGWVVDAQLMPQMGRAVGAAAMLAKKYDTTPRGVYQNHLEELQNVVFAQGDYEGRLARKEAE
jgi:hypothetical protein